MGEQGKARTAPIVVRALQADGICVPLAANDVDGQGVGDEPTEDAATVPRRDGKGRFLPRKRSASIAAPAVTKQARKGGARGKAKTKAPARQRWTAKAQNLFLEALAQTGNVAHATRLAGLSDSTIYRRRRQSEDFRLRWAEALREGYAKLEAEVLDRAINGTDKPIFHAGKHVATVRQYNDNLAMQLIRQHRDAVHGPLPAAVADLSEAQLRALVSEQLAEANRRMGGKG